MRWALKKGLPLIVPVGGFCQGFGRRNGTEMEGSRVAWRNEVIGDKCGPGRGSIGGARRQAGDVKTNSNTANQVAIKGGTAGTDDSLNLDTNLTRSPR